MPKYTSIIITVVLCVFATSCNFNKQEDCIALDNTISTTNDTLMLKGNAWGDEFEVAVNTLDFSQLNKRRTDMQSYIERKIDEVDELEPVGKAEDLLAAEKEFLEYERLVVAEKFSVFEQYDTTVTMDELRDSYVNLQLSSEKEQDLIEKVQQKREEYAEQNDFPKFIDKN